ncbi:MAG: peptidoglycan-associated lipoprotein Pal [Candidatus Omnitrophica bacterium]|nr:peptidoglycan-associated lipoprotein Pal [Candidatus Omnitrophota bacterium]MCM8810726.1 peptidoglycan-associated lipoprotein Pal [Candidatus Omnitrophota bacterium]
MKAGKDCGIRDLKGEFEILSKFFKNLTIEAENCKLVKMELTKFKIMISQKKYLKYLFISTILIFQSCQNIETKRDEVKEPSLKEKISNLISTSEPSTDLSFQIKEIPKVVSIKKDEEEPEKFDNLAKALKESKESLEYPEENLSEQLYQFPENIKFVSPSELSKEFEEVFKNIYFDYDSYEIKKSEQETLIKISEFLQKNKEIVVLIEGHCDERGTREYNLVLGEQRALSVRNFLINLGISPKRLFTVSYGEDKPAVIGSNENAWAKNRRCEFKIGIEKK